MSVINWNILYVADPLRNRPLGAGKIFVGEPDLDPEVPANQKQLNVVQEDGTVVAVTQPFVLSYGGVPMYNGSPVRLDVDGNYSIKALDKNDTQTYFVDNVFDGQPVLAEDLEVLINPLVDTQMINDLTQAYEFTTLDDAVTSTISFPPGKVINIKERTAGNGGGATWDVVLASTVTENGRDIVQCTGIATLSLVMRNVEDVYTVATVADLIATDLIPTQTAKTQGYYAGWNSQAEADGSADYIIADIQDVRDEKGDQSWTPDGKGDHLLNNNFVAMLITKQGNLNADQFGLIIEDITKDQSNTDTINAMLLQIGGGDGGVINLPYGRAYYKEPVILDDGMSIVGIDTVSYRDDYRAVSRMTFTEDVDGITYNSFNSYRNTIKDVKIDTVFEGATSTKTGINFSSNGGSTGTRGLANILENVTVEHFKVGITTSSPGDFAWNAEFKNIKLYRCQEHLIIDGSNGVCQIDGLHIDGSGDFEWGSSVIGVKLLNANGYILRNYGIEGCNTGLSWQGNEDNDRLYLYSGYFENNSTSDVSFEDNSQGQFYSYGSRMASFASTAKNQSVFGGAGASVKATFYDLTMRGEQDGADGLIRAFLITQSSVRIELQGYLHQVACPIWADFSPNVAPEYIKLTNQDKNSNFVELYRDTLQPHRMTAWTQRVSAIAPNADTFIINLPDGTELDLKYSGATVRGKTFGAWNEWLWDGTSAFIKTP